MAGALRGAPRGPIAGASRSRQRRANRRLGSLYIGGVWNRIPKEPHMQRLLGLLLVMGMVGCGERWLDADRLSEAADVADCWQTGISYTRE